jgi:HEAT repeat protein
MPPSGGPPDVGILKESGDVKGLIKALRYGRGYARGTAVRRDAAHALARIGPSLEDPRLRKRAARALMRALADSETLVRGSAARALGEIVPTLRDLRFATRAAKRLGLALAGEEWDTREEAAKALAQIGPPAVESLIGTLLGEGQFDARRLAARALGETGDQRAVEPLYATLDDPDWMVSGEAAVALGKFGDSRAAEPLVERLVEPPAGWDREEDVMKGKRDIAEALQRIGEPAIQPLLAALSDGNTRARERALIVLEQVGAPSDIEARARYAVARKDWDAAIKLGGAAVEPLLTAAVIWYSDAAARALVDIGPPAVEPLIAALGDGPERRRIVSARMLGQIGDLRAMDALVSCLQDESLPLRVTTAASLDALRWQPDTGETKAAYWRVHVDRCIDALEAPSKATRQKAARELMAMHTSDRLNDAHRQLILAQRSTITAPHRDGHVHYDESHTSSDCTLSRTLHGDQGIGLEFQV